MDCRVGKGATAPCPPCILRLSPEWWARLRFAHPTRLRDPRHKIAKTTPCKVEGLPERLTRRRGGLRPSRSRRRRCQIRTGEGIGSCIPEGPPVRRAFPSRAAAIVATLPPELRAKAPSRRRECAGPRQLRHPCQGACGTGDRSVRCSLRAARAAS